MNKLQIGLEIIKTLNAHSYEAYIVGGAVRDYIRKKDIEDVDITTNATISQVAALFEQVSLEGKNYLSCRIHLYDMVFEVTSFRKDIEYIDHRHPISMQANTLEEDLLRRDFTMNALVMDQYGTITDLFHGIDDIHQGIIRMIGNPMVRFEEDALRVLRAIYFSARMNFVLEEEILQSFTKDYIGYLKEEYIIEMVEKIISAPYEIGLQYIKDYKLLYSYPFYQVMCEDVLKFNYKKDSYSLFYALHHFLPANLKISTKIRNKAKSVMFWIQNEFNSFALFYGDIEVLDIALEMYERITGKLLIKSDLLDRKQSLPIKNARDIKISWDKVVKEKRSKYLKKIVKEILFGTLKNEEKEILKYLETEE